MAGYTRVDTINNIADGNVINAADLDGEFDGIQAAFNSSTGHNHDGTAGEGAPILALGPVQDVTISTTVLGVKTNNTVDLGTTGLRFKDFYLAGNASVNGTLGVTGVATFTAQPILSSLTASQAVFTNASKGLVSNAITGTGNVVMSASPTLTGTLDAAAATFSGAVTLGDASADAITVNGTTTFNASPIISVTDNTNAALRITQTGTGDALLIEDSTNPDSTPFVIDASGVVINGYTTAVATQNYGGSAVTAALYQQHGNTQNTSTAAVFNWSSSVASPANLILNKSISNVVGTRGALTAANTDIGSVTFNGDDGTNFIPAATILAELDGTPGTNDMPGRLVFSTTADGASVPTERMRINSAGNVGLNATSLSNTAFRNSVNITGSTTSYAMFVDGVVQSDVTSSAVYFTTSARTAATSFTANNIKHYRAAQSTFGVGSTVTVQYGFVAEDNLIGATNNYGFYGDLASGTGRWNLYMNGTADNYLAGGLGIGSATLTGRKVVVSGAVTGATTAYGLYNAVTFQSDVTTHAYGIRSQGQTQAAAFTLPLLSHYAASQGTFGAGSTVTTQYGFNADASLTGATNNYGFYGNLASGTGRYNLYMNGTADNYIAGNVGIGTTSPAVKLDVSGTMRSTSATTTGAAGGTITPTSDTTNQYTITALGAAATIAIPSGTPIDGQKLTIRIKDNGTARALTWTTTAGGYRIIGTTLPVTTVVSKTVYIGCVYNSADSFWDVVAVAQQA